MGDASEPASPSPAPRSSGAGRPIELTIEYRRLNAFFADYLRNISRGTMFIRSARSLPVGTEFLFQLHVPRLARPLALHGAVSRIVAASDADGTGAGMAVTFLYREGTPRDEVARVVERLMADTLGPRLGARLVERARGAAAVEVA